MSARTRTDKAENATNANTTKSASAKRRNADRHRTDGLDEESRARADSDSGSRATRHPLLQLQQRRGNRAVQRVVEEQVQPKLEVGRPDDKYEREADRMAKEITSTPAPNHSYTRSTKMISRKHIQRMCPRCRKRHAEGKPLGCPDCEQELRRAETAQTVPNVDADVQRRIRANQNGGRPLPTSVRSFFEPRFGHDFGDVRVYTGPRADDAAQAVHARAFTLGRDVVFRSGEYRPNTDDGKQLLAHELVHVVQQEGSNSRSVVHRNPDPDPESEPTPGTAAAGPKMTVSDSQTGDPCACLVVVHNNERNARETAQLIHQYCAYNLILVQPDDRRRNILLPGVGRIDPNALFPRDVAEQCLNDEASCRQELTRIAASTKPGDVQRYAEIQFFLSVSDCSNSFSLPVIALHNNDLKDTKAFHKKKAGIDLSDLEMDIDKTQTEDAGNGQIERLQSLLDEKFGESIRIQVTRRGKTSIFRWCVATGLSRCHIGDPENPDDVIWVTNERDFERLSREDVNVALQTEIPPPGSAAHGDLSTLLLYIEEIVGLDLQQRLHELAQARAVNVQEIGKVIASLEALAEYDDLLLEDVGTAVFQILGEVWEILLSIMVALGEVESAQNRIRNLRYINIETPMPRSGGLTDAERISNYELVVSVLKSLGLYCCGENPSQAEERIKSSLRREKSR